jgi:hypothetical protein
MVCQPRAVIDRCCIYWSFHSVYLQERCIRSYVLTAVLPSLGVLWQVRFL